MRSNQSRQSRSFVERRRRRAIVGWTAAVLALGSWIFIFSRVSFMPSLQISSVEIYGTDAELVPLMHAATAKAIDGAYAGIFSKANAFIYPKADVVMWIASTSPRVSNVKVRRNGLQTLAVSISEKAPDAIVCADLPDLSDNTLHESVNCYVADESGFIFRRIKPSDAAGYSRYYIPELAAKDLSGRYATSTAKFKNLQSLIRGLKSSGISVQAILLKEGQEYEIYADNPGGKSLVVIQMSERVPLDVQRENLIAYWSRMVAEAKAKGKKLEWSEIKLQYPPNVYSRSIEDVETP